MRNHGLLTVGLSVDSAVGYFLLMERSAEVQMKAREARPISAEAARPVHDEYDDRMAWQVFQWAQRNLVPDVESVLTRGRLGESNPRPSHYE